MLAYDKTQCLPYWVTLQLKFWNSSPGFWTSLNGELWKEFENMDISSTVLDFSQISFVCLIAWFDWAGLIRLRDLPDLPEHDWSGWEGVPDLPEQDRSGWEGWPDLPEQDWSGWERYRICLSRIFYPDLANQAIRQTTKIGWKCMLVGWYYIPPCDPLNFPGAFFSL